MSFDASWAAFNGVPKSEVLRVAGLVETGQTSELWEGRFNVAELRSGWTILYAPNSVYVYEGIKRLSADHAVLWVVIQEYVPLSLAAYHVRGEQVWLVMHNANRDVLDLQLEGAVPPQAGAIAAKQRAAAQASPGVDHMYEVPIELAASICGFWHNHMKTADGETPLYHFAEPARP